ncbi:MAG: IS1 family transposase [Planctomycetota bacterium]
MYSLSIDQKTTVLRALVEGCSIRSTERMTGHHRDTIMRLLVEAGSKAEEVMREMIKDVPLNYLQADELWTFIGKKEKNLTYQERGSDNIGLQFIFVAIDSETKLIPCFRVGKRNIANATLFMCDLRNRIKGKPNLTTDSLPAYVEAVKTAFGLGVNYAQLVKVYRSNGDAKVEGYSPIDFVRTRQITLWGKPRKRNISTSHVERQNLTLRMSLRRLTRLTNGFSKKYSNLIAALNLHFAYYNFVRIHRSLRMTPAMKAGITGHIWSIEEIMSFSA